MSDFLLDKGLQEKLKATIEGAFLEISGDDRDAAVGYVIGFCMGYLAKRAGLDAEGADAFVNQMMMIIQRRVIAAATRTGWSGN